jgi:hypothetical protein
MSTEFGHIAARGKGLYIDSWGAGPFEITVGGKLFRFEDSDRFGPTPLDAEGEPLPEYFSSRSPFWYGWHRWKDQGRRVAKDEKTCVWEDG